MRHTDWDDKLGKLISDEAEFYGLAVGPSKQLGISCGVVTNKPIKHGEAICDMTCARFPSETRLQRLLHGHPWYQDRLIKHKQSCSEQVLFEVMLGVAGDSHPPEFDTSDGVAS